MGINEIIQIGNRIRKIRTEKGLTQREMAALTGIPYSTYSNYENNNREPNLEQLNKIANALNISITHLIDINDITKQSQNILDDLSNHPENWVQENPLTGEKVPIKQTELLKHYNVLNELGKNKAIERIKELVEIPRYTKEK